MRSFSAAIAASRSGMVFRLQYSRCSIFACSRVSFLGAKSSSSDIPAPDPPSNARELTASLFGSSIGVGHRPSQLWVDTLAAQGKDMKSSFDESFRQQVRQALSQQTAGSAPAPAAATVDTLFARAVAHHQAGQLPQAEALYRQILQAAPSHAGALHLLGVIASQVGQHGPALELIDRAIAIHPQYAEAHFARGAALDAMKQYQAAVESYDRAIQLKPNYAEAYYNRGNSLNALRQSAAALESYDKAIQLKPDYTEAYCNRGILLCVLRQYRESLESCDKAILLRPDLAEAHFGRATALSAMEQYQPALQSFDKAILLKPQFAEAHNNRGNALLALQQYEAALQSYDRVIQLRPDSVEAHNNRGDALQTIGEYAAALESYDQAYLLKPDHDYLPGARLFMRRFLCIWGDGEDEWLPLEAPIQCGLKVTPPFVSLAFSESPEIQKLAAEIYVNDKAPARASAAISRRARRNKIRIGYFSTDYYNNATSYLMAEIFELHNRNRFEVLAFSFGPDVEDEMSRRVSAAMDRFLDIRSMTDREAAELSRSLGVDIAVDLKGHTLGHRTGIFAERAAPIQVNYLGYPGTMGAEYMDYLIADETVIPQTSQKYYSEKIIYLPDSYQCNDSQRAISTKPCTRAEEGLPQDAFVFCCFNNSYKITPETFSVWMRILRRVDGSILWLWKNKPWATENLRKEAERRGISGDRVIFARTLPLDEHLARHRLADLFLDTFPYNAHTTASHALWTGLPVLTRTGETFASRVGASLLRAVGLPELITTSQEEFEEQAVELANDTERRTALRHRLQQDRLSAPLFDSRAFTRHLEAAYTAIVERQEAGLPPEHIIVPRITSPHPGSTRSDTSVDSPRDLSRTHLPPEPL